MQNHGRWNIFTPLTDDMGWHNLGGGGEVCICLFFLKSQLSLKSL